MTEPSQFQRCSAPGLVAIALSWIVSAAPLHAQTTEDLIDRLRDCRGIADSQARLRCFDAATRMLDPQSPEVAEQAAAFESESDAGPASESTARPRQRLAAEQREIAAERERLARRREALERRERELADRSEQARVLVNPQPADLEQAFGANQLPDYDKPLPEEKLSELRTRIIGAAAKPTGEWVMTLANGQVWVQTQPEHYPLNLSDGPIDVVLFRNIFGGYYLRKADENVRLRVKRIQ